MEIPKNSANNGQFKPGNPGKPKGAVSHLTRTVKETVLAVFNEIQEDPKVNLKAFAKKYPRDFYNIAAKLIPTEITGQLATVININEVLTPLAKPMEVENAN